MDDHKIIELYWERDETAIQETALRYGGLCAQIAQNILSSREDSEECVNDTYLALWNAIPDQRPKIFSAFIGRITRNLALKRYDYISAAKRSSSATASLEELGDCVSGTDSVVSELERRRIQNAIDTFLWAQSDAKRTVFIRRYWYFDSIERISRRTGFSESKVRSMLYELRRKLRAYLESEEIEV